MASNDTRLANGDNTVNPNGDSIEDLTKEVELLKQKLEEERAKFNDVERMLFAYHLQWLNLSRNLEFLWVF